MAHRNTTRPGSAQVVLPAVDLDQSIGFFRDGLGLKLDMIFPADSPRVAVMSGFGLTLHLDSGLPDDGRAQKIGSIEELAALVGGTQGYKVVGLAAPGDPVDVPEFQPRLTFTPPPAEDDWSVGRAGMQYRDLIPGRLGGAVIASHIRIPSGGPVPDYVHHHHVRFQLIYCLRGWTRLVYEDQGPPFVMQAGDCVLQPPHIRHRVLECSDGFEVVEVGCPAEHQTLVDHQLELPTGQVAPERDFSGQTFAFHQAAGAEWVADGEVEVRDTGLSAASADNVDVRACRPHAGKRVHLTPSKSFCFGFVLGGQSRLEIGSEIIDLSPDASFVLPGHMNAIFDDCTADFAWLMVSAEI